MVKFWKYIIEYMNYWEGYNIIDSNREEAFLTRENWDGLHYKNRWGEYCILLKSGEILINPIDIWDMDEPNWIIVEPTQEALEIIKAHSEIREYD